ncbi:pleckstrin homology domain-containing family S member 1-like [Cetorhinus maximus]
MTGKGTRLSPVFYSEEDGISENDICCEGYLIKSPPNSQIGLQTSWKKRYFVLTKKKGEPILIYFKYQEQSRRSQPRGKIHLKKATEICSRPDNHPKWNIIQRMFKCISESVILLKTEARDYFFIGEIEPIQLWRGKIENLLHMETMPQSEEQAQDSFGKLAKTEQHQQPGNKSYPIYATIPELPVQNDKTKTEGINPEPHFESPSSEKAKNIYDIPRATHNRLSQPNQCPIKTEKLRSCSLPPEFERDSAIYDTPRRILAAQWKRVRTVSGDSGIYMSMASIRDSTSTNSSFDCSEQIDEKEEHLINETNNVIEETKLAKLDVMVFRDYIKNNLSFQQVNERICVMSLDKKCPFNFGDQILAINKLQIHDIKEFNTLVDKSLEEEVTVTILRLPEAPKFDSEERK